MHAMLSVDPDLELLERWRSGERRAGDELFSRHFKGIRSYFFLKFPNEHEDLIQETFSRMVENRDRFRGESTFKTYLFRIAGYVGAEHLRRRYKLGDAFSPATSSLADVTRRRQSSILAGREDRRLLLDALWNLPIEQQDLIQLYYWQDLTANQVGEILDIPVPTVRGRLRLAIGRLGKLHKQLAAQEHSRELEEDELEQWLVALRSEIERATIHPG